MSKGKGVGSVSGGITEEKILQAYVASSRAGGCGPSGCGPSSSGCGPSAPVGPRINNIMLEYVTNTLQQVASQPLGLVFALILGVVSAATSACCTLPALGILVGYSGAAGKRQSKGGRQDRAALHLGNDCLPDDYWRESPGLSARLPKVPWADTGRSLPV